MENKKGIWVFRALLLFLLLPNILAFFVAKDLPTVAERCIYLISALLMYGVGLVVFKRRTFLYVASLGLFFSAIETVHLIINQATTSLLFVFTIIKSEKGEFLELLSMYWWVVVFFFALWGVYFFLAHKYVPNDKVLSKTESECLLGGVVTFIVLGAYTLSDGVKVAPINMVYNLARIARIEYRIHQDQQNVQNYRFGVEKASNDPQTIVVLVLGETSRYDHWQLNGYSRPTSPRLMERKDQIVSFEHAYSVANLTTVSVPMMLSEATPFTLSDYTKEQSVVEAFHEAGYRTAWIADQSFNNRFLQRISATCDDTEYIHDSGDTLFADYLLIEPFARQIALDGRQMLVLHSLGCHFKYSERYPEGFGPFQPDMRQMQRVEGQTLLQSAQTLLVNSYDNAILYTDFFLDSLISLLEASERPAVLVYVGDHGENLLDDDKHMFLHGTYAGSEYEYHVPLFVWTSEAYKKSHPHYEAALHANTPKYLTTMSLFHSLLDFGDVAYPYINKEYSFVRDEMMNDTILIGLDANLNPFTLPLAPAP